MATTNITFDDKILGQANALPENKKLTFTNANEIKSVVNNNATELTSTQADVATNTSGIATNVTNIATNAADIATNVTNIATNTSGVASNLASIGTNTTNIATNTSGIATNEANIVSLDGRVTTNESNITNKANIADVVLKADYSPSHSLLVQQNGTGSPSAVSVSNNSLIGRKSGGGSQIESLSSTESKELLFLENVDNTSDLNKPISTATQSALDLKATVVDLTIAEGNIETNGENIATNTSNISTNTANIATNASNISTNTSAISTNVTNIGTNTIGVNTNAGKISTNIANIATNTSNIATNVTAIGNRIEKNIGTTYTTNALTTVTQAEYDAIDAPDATTIYFII